LIKFEFAEETVASVTYGDITQLIRAVDEILVNSADPTRILFANTGTGKSNIKTNGEIAPLRPREEMEKSFSRFATVASGPV